MRKQAAGILSPTAFDVSIKNISGITQTQQKEKNRK